MCYADERTIEELRAANRDLLQLAYCLLDQQGGKAVVTPAQIVSVPSRAEIVSVPQVDGSVSLSIRADR